MDKTAVGRGKTPAAAAFFLFIAVVIHDLIVGIHDIGVGAASILSTAAKTGAAHIGTRTGLARLPACLLVGCIAMVPSLVTGRFQRWQGGVLLLSYVVYLVITCSGAAL